MTDEKLSVEIKSRFDDRVLFTAELGTRYAERPYREKLGAVIVRALGEGANLRGAGLEGADLRDADLKGADLRGADLRVADLEAACLRGADLEGADLRDADLRDADLRGANLWGADLRGADLRGADLEAACLRDANLRGANLRDANLWGADLRGADLRVATAIDAGQDIRGYRFVGIPYDDGIRIAAGCRWFTLAEAREHWAGDDRETNAECREHVEMIARIARRRGWTIGDEQEAAG